MFCRQKQPVAYEVHKQTNKQTNKQKQKQKQNYASQVSSALYHLIPQAYAREARSYSLRARSQFPVVGVTGCAPGWPGAFKLPGAAE